jgi:hypothetical protein
LDAKRAIETNQGLSTNFCAKTTFQGQFPWQVQKSNIGQITTSKQSLLGAIHENAPALANYNLKTANMKLPQRRTNSDMRLDTASAMLNLSAAETNSQGLQRESISDEGTRGAFYVLSHTDKKKNEVLKGIEDQL